MRAAPPVSVRCTGGPGWRLVQSALAVVAAAAFAAWALGHAQLPLAWAPVAGLVCAAASWPLSRPRARLLVWDGQRWACDGMPGALDVMIDLGGWMLLRLRPGAVVGASALWIPLTAREAGAALHGLRAAVYSRPPEATPRVRSAKRATD